MHFFTIFLEYLTKMAITIIFNTVLSHLQFKYLLNVSRRLKYIIISLDSIKHMSKLTINQ